MFSLTVCLCWSLAYQILYWSRLNPTLAPTRMIRMLNGDKRDWGRSPPCKIINARECVDKNNNYIIIFLWHHLIIGYISIYQRSECSLSNYFVFIIFLWQYIKIVYFIPYGGYSNIYLEKIIVAFCFFPPTFLENSYKLSKQYYKATEKINSCKYLKFIVTIIILGNSTINGNS